MIYADDTQKELEAILKAFDTYIKEQDYFDIVYSKKIGYIWIVVDPPGAAGAEQLDTPEKMLEVLFSDIISEVVNSPDNTTHIQDALILSKYEEAESRRRITAILNRIEGDRAKYLKELDIYIKNYQEGFRKDNKAKQKGCQ